MTTRPAAPRVSYRTLAPRHRPDPWLLVATACLAGLGLVMVFNSSYFYAQERFGDPYLFVRKQVIALMIGSCVLFGISRVRVQWFEKSAQWLLLGSVASLVLLFFIGISRNNASSWLYFGSFNIQPAEFAKVAIVLYLARSIARYRDRMEEFKVGIVRHVVMVGICAVLIAFQPDVGTAIVLISVLGLMLFVGGARLTHLTGLALLAAPVIAIVIASAPYRLNRVRALLDPWAFRYDIAFQLVQSMIAFGSGGWTGVGLGESQQKLLFLPEAHTDFIFSVIGEEMGLTGVAFVLGLFAVIGIRGFRIAIRHPDPFASMLALGLTVVILLEVAVNVGVAVGLVPTTGLALPFLSYGGSALVRVMLQIGILAGLSRMTG